MIIRSPHSPQPRPLASDILRQHITISSESLTLHETPTTRRIRAIHDVPVAIRGIIVFN